MLWKEVSSRCRIVIMLDDNGAQKGARFSFLIFERAPFHFSRSRKLIHFWCMIMVPRIRSSETGGKIRNGDEPSPLGGDPASGE